MAPESVAVIASEMAPDDRADLFSALSDKTSEEVFEALTKVDPEAAQEVRDIEKWPDTSAGHLLTTDYVSVTPRMRVDEALERVRRHVREHEESVHVIYVLDGKTLAGVVALSDLLVAQPDFGMAEVMHTIRSACRPTMDQEEVARRMAKYDLNVMPVVTDDGVMLGVITIDDVVDVLLQEQTEDVQKIGAVEPLDVPYFQTSFCDVHPEARRLAHHSVRRGVLHPDGASVLRPDHGGRQRRAPLRAPAHLGRRKLRVAVVHAHHPRARARRDQAARLVAHPCPRTGHGDHPGLHDRRHRHGTGDDVSGPDFLFALTVGRDGSHASSSRDAR